jgi:hypothetical protein
MKEFLGLIIVVWITLYFVSCAKPIEPEIRKPTLFITVKDDSGKSVAGASVRLYKNMSDTGITQFSDSTGIVIFYELDTTRYYWLAQKGCSTNRVSQTTLNRPLLPNGVFYGYSVLTKTGTLRIINTSSEPYKVSDSLFSFTVYKDTPYIGHRRVRSYTIHSEKATTPGVGKDTLINIRCGDTSLLSLPY